MHKTDLQRWEQRKNKSKPKDKSRVQSTLTERAPARTAHGDKEFCRRRTRGDKAAAGKLVNTLHGDKTVAGKLVNTSVNTSAAPREARMNERSHHGDADASAAGFDLGHEPLDRVQLVVKYVVAAIVRLKHNI